MRRRIARLGLFSGEVPGDIDFRFTQWFSLLVRYKKTQFFEKTGFLCGSKIFVETNFVAALAIISYSLFILLT